jgi:hypothetical protein
MIADRGKAECVRQSVVVDLMPWEAVYSLFFSVGDGP